MFNYVVNRVLQRKRGRMYAFFVDHRTTFDSVDREKLWKALKEKGMSKKLRERIRKIYEKTVSKMKAEGLGG